MTDITNTTNKTFCMSEYDELKRVILCQPQYMTIREVINETQNHFKNEGIHIERALEQHGEFVKTLKKMISKLFYCLIIKNILNRSLHGILVLH